MSTATDGIALEVRSIVLVPTLALAVLVGVVLGLLGGGGSILTVPILTYVAGMETKHAIASSLFVVAVTSSFAVVGHARAGRVRWRIGVGFGLAGMAGAYGGGRLAGAIPANVLMVAFALVMVAAALAMLRGRYVPVGRAPREPALGAVAMQGAAVGMVAGLVGAGGGFLIVPALVFLGGLGMEAAVGTSLLVISMQSFAGFAGHLDHVRGLDWTTTLAVTAIAVVGSYGGAALAGRIAPQKLRAGFGVFVLVVAALVLARELL